MQISNYGIELFREFGCETRYSDHMRLKIGVIIPTKDRPQNVQKVLESFVGQEVDQVVVCGSGEDLTPVIGEFKNRIPIRYIKAESGQINQKLEAISQHDLS